jgi:hypothetical protein
MRKGTSVEILSRQEAMATLRIGEIPHNFKNEDLSDFFEKAYLKMLNRYPPEFFPERVIAIRRAYLRLSQDIEYWSEFFKEIKFS